MLKYLVVLVLLLAGCAAEDREIRYHEVNKSDLIQMGNYGSATYGYALWDNDICDIYVMPLLAYPSEECYYAVLGHEERHCKEGNFHGPSESESRTAECFKP